MSDDGLNLKLSNFFPVGVDSFRVDSVVPFDCFIHLEKNSKILHWMREGTVFTVDRREKLLRLGSPQVFVMNFQKSSYQEYISLSGDGKIIIDQGKASTTESKVPHGRAVQGAPEGAAGSVVKVEGVPPDTSGGAIRVFGSMAARDLKLQKAMSSPDRVADKGVADGLKLKIDVNFLNAVIKATQEVFQDMFLTTVSFGTPKRRTQTAASSTRIDVASFIGLTSQSIRGTVGLCFPLETYTYLLRQATGVNYKTVELDHFAGCAEFLYYIFETARPELVTLGYQVDRAVPTLVVGENLSLPHVIPDQGFSIVFDSPGGSFNFELGFKTGA